MLPTFSAVLRPVPDCYTSEEVHDELIKANYPILTTIRLSGADKHPWSLIAVTVKDTPEGRALSQLKKLFTSDITVEPRRRPMGPTQCTRCRQFGHLRAHVGLNRYASAVEKIIPSRIVRMKPLIAQIVMATIQPILQIVLLGLNCSNCASRQPPLFHKNLPFHPYPLPPSLNPPSPR